MTQPDPEAPVGGVPAVLAVVPKISPDFGLGEDLPEEGKRDL
jgi:hypothetical protein